MLAIDSETRRSRPGLQAPPLVCVSFTERTDQRASLVHHTEAYEVVRWALSQELTTANGVYDFSVFCARWPEFIPAVFEGLIEGLYHDVLIRQKLIDIGQGNYRAVYKKVDGKMRNLGYSLEDLTLRHTPLRLEKSGWRLRYGELENIPVARWPQGAIDYACEDATSNLMVHLAQEGGVNLHNEAAQVRAAWALQLASCWGFHTDNKYVQKVLEDIDKEQIHRKARLIGEGLVRLNGSRNIAQAKSRMLSVADVRTLKLTDKGEKLVRSKAMSREVAIAEGYFSLDEESCAATNDPVLVEYAAYSGFQLLRSKIEALHSNTPIQTRFEVLLNTGRTSSSARTEQGSKKPEEGSAAVQNPPREEGFRECFIPGRGMVLVSCDYDIAELVSLSQVTYALFGFSAMRDAINGGFDPHTDFAAFLLGIGYTEAQRRLKAGDAEMEFYRQLAKVWNFGAPGGLGNPNFIVYAKGMGVDLTLPQVKKYRNAWLKQWPEMSYYFRHIGRLIDKNGCEVSRDDGSTYKRGTIQHFMSERIRGMVSYTEACNSMFQGLTADASKAAMFEVSRHCYAVPSSALYGSRIVNFVHDELILELPEVIAHEAAQELEKIMIREYQKYTPDVKIGAKATLMRRWRKKAKRRMQNGRLIPFEDHQEVA